MNVMDWFNATTNDCQAPIWGSNTTCSGSNYLFKGIYEWTISPPYASNSASLFLVFSAGGFDYNGTVSSYGTRPSFYLTSNIQLKGEGTSTSPFKIS